MIVQRVTALVVIFVAITCAYLDSWMTEESQIFINNFYYTSQKDAKQPNETNWMDDDFTMDSFIGQSDDNKYIGLVKNDSVESDTTHEIAIIKDTNKDHAHEVHHIRNTTELKPHDHAMHHMNRKDKVFNHNYTFEEPQTISGSGSEPASFEFETARCPTNYDMDLEQFIDWMSTVDKSQAEECASDGIDSLFLFSFVAFGIFFVCVQKYIQILLVRMAKNQKTLEDKFMGPELI